MESNSAKSTSYFNLIIRIAIIVACFFLAKFMGGLTLIAFATSGLLGVLLATWLMKREKVYLEAIDWFVWSNIVTWFIPLLGVFTGAATLIFSDKIENKKLKYRIFGSIGLGLALINAIGGTFMNMHH